MKKLNLIAPDDVGTRFDDGWIGSLNEVSKMRLTPATQAKFCEDIRDTIRNFLRASGEPSLNEQHKETYKLFRAAESALKQRGKEDQETKRCIIVANLLENLSDTTRRDLESRVKRLDGRIPNLPNPDELRDQTTRDTACAAITAITSFGGRFVEGRRRGTDKRSRTFQPFIYAPSVNARPAKRENEDDCVMWLQYDWTRATGRRPAFTANSISPGPFARFASACLKRAGANHVDVVEIINRLNGLRRTTCQAPIP